MGFPQLFVCSPQCNIWLCPEMVYLQVEAILITLIGKLIVKPSKLVVFIYFHLFSSIKSLIMVLNGLHHDFLIDKPLKKKHTNKNQLQRIQHLRLRGDQLHLEKRNFICRIYKPSVRSHNPIVLICVYPF